jgi:hypothetical protein
MNHLITLLVETTLNIASEAVGNTRTLPLGLIVVGIIEAPVLILLIATLLGKPRQPKITGIFIGFFSIMVMAFIGTVFGLSYLLGLFY